MSLITCLRVKCSTLMNEKVRYLHRYLYKLLANLSKEVSSALDCKSEY